MTQNLPNSQRARPAQSFTLPRYQLSYISEAASLSDRKKSAVLESIIADYMDRSAGDPHVPVRRVPVIAEGVSEM